MKKLSFIVMACLLALGLTQCKKNEPTNNNNDDNRVSITLKLTNGGQKVHPEEDPETGWANVVYDNGDVVYVGSDGKYVGYLTYNGSVFVGSINAEATEGQPLQFVFMGGQDFHESLTENSSTDYTFNIGDQSNGMAVISCAAANENFSATKLDYTAYLRNKCALVKFDLGAMSTDAAITLTGLKTEATIGFDGTVTNGETTGNIVTYGTGSTRYAVVLSDQEAVTEGTLSAEGYEGTFSIPTAAYTNAFLTDATMTLTAASTDPLATPLTLEALTDGTIVVQNPKSGMQYTLNGGAKTAVTSEAIPVSVGDKVRFYGDGTSISTYSGTRIAGGTAQVKAFGNIMSLIDETGYATLTTLPNKNFVFSPLFSNNTTLTDASGLLLPATTLAIRCYFSMFSGCTSLTTAPVLPAETLADYCYYGMFSGCASLTTAPELPATTLAQSCYYYMFSGCTDLTTAPALPATTLAQSCYSNMFSGCTSLTTAALPATTLAQSCYSNMFSGCTSLTAAPELPATTLAASCYYNMFSGCTNLTTAPALPATTLASDCYRAMFSGCTSLTGVPELPATTLASYCYREMFSGCTSLTGVPELPATTLADHCYSFMFYNCTGLTTVPALPATTLADYCYGDMFSGCTSLTTAPALPVTTLTPGCYAGMFWDCTSLTAAPELPATTLTYECYADMFSGCTGLTTAPELPATTLAGACYSYMFNSCTSLTTAPALPATTLAEQCYYYMFGGCTSLTTAPALPATTLDLGCYFGMFADCTSLTAAPALPSTSLAYYCYDSMFGGCTSLTTAPVLPATTLVDGCYSSMFLGCTNLSSIICLATAGINENYSTYNWVNSVASTGTFTKASGATWPTGVDGIPSGWTVVEQ